MLAVCRKYILVSVICIHTILCQLLFERLKLCPEEEISLYNLKVFRSNTHFATSTFLYNEVEKKFKVYEQCVDIQFNISNIFIHNKISNISYIIKWFDLKEHITWKMPSYLLRKIELHWYWIYEILFHIRPLYWEFIIP